MAIAVVGALGTANSKASGTTLAITTAADAEVGHLIVVVTAWDNTDTSDVEGIRLGVSDSAGNLYRCVGDRVNAGPSGGAAATGAELAIFVCVVETQLSSGGTITVTSQNARIAKAATAHEFTIGTNTVCLAAKVNVNNLAVDPGACTLSGLTSGEYLFLHGLAAEGPQTDAYTWDADYTQFAGDGTTGSTDDTNMHVRAGYRIATLTGDTVDVTSTTADRDYAQVLVALREYDAVPPAPSLLDDFNRANETPLAAPWTKTDSAGLRLISNAVGVQAGGGAARASHRTGFSSDLAVSGKVSADITSAGDRIGVVAHMTGTTLDSFNGYTLSADARAGTDLVLLRWTTNATVNLTSLTVATLGHAYIEVSAGDELCIQTVDTVVEGWFKSAAGAYRLLVAVDDSTSRTGLVGPLIRDTGTAGRLDDVKAAALLRPGFLASTTVVYAPIMVGTVETPFLASNTVVYGPTLQGAVEVPFLPPNTVVYPPTLESPNEIDIPFLASQTRVFPIFSLFVDTLLAGIPGNGGEMFPIRLAPNGGGEIATLATSIDLSSRTLALTGDGGMPGGAFVIRIDSEVLYVLAMGGGNYLIRGRGLSNTLAAAHGAGASATWSDSYDMAIVASVDIGQHFVADITSTGSYDYPGWLISLDATQAYLGSSRYPMHVTEVLGVFDAGVGVGGSNRLDAAQPGKIWTPTGASDDCPAALSNPARIQTDILAGDVAVVRYTNPEPSVLELGPRSTSLQSWFGLKRVDASDVDVTFTDTTGTVIDGMVNGVWDNPLGPALGPDTGLPSNHDVPYTSVTLPGADRFFTYGPPGYSEKGWPIGALAVRQGKRRVPFWRSWDWHNFNYVYCGYDVDATFVQMVINRNGIIFGSVPEVDLPGPQDIDGPDAVWDDGSYQFAASWYVAIYNSPYLVAGPAIGGSNDGGGAIGGTGGYTPTVDFSGGPGSPTVTVPSVEGGSGGGILPPSGFHIWHPEISPGD